MGTVRQEQVDRYPADYHGCGIVEDRLKQALKVDTHKELLEKLKVDIVDIRGVVDPTWVADFPKNRYVNGIKETYLGFQMKEQDTVFGKVEEHCGFQLEDAESVEDLEKFRWPQVDWFDFTDFADRLKEYDDFAVMASGASVYQHPTLVRGIDNLLCDMITDPEIADFIMWKYTNFYLDYYAKMFESAPGKIDILRCADDLGMQDRCMLGEKEVRRFILPPVKALADMAHSYGVKFMFHSCGAVSQFIPLLMDVGVDILDPLQPLAKDMNPENIASKFLGKICLHGSVDTQYTLPKGSPDDVRAEVQHRMRIYGANKTGFIIAPSHSLQPDVKTENILALYDEVDKINQNF